MIHTRRRIEQEGRAAEGYLIALCDSTFIKYHRRECDQFKNGWGRKLPNPSPACTGRTNH